MTRREQLQRALDLMGNTHTPEDILRAIQRHEMQSFAIKDTWAVTQVCTFPQRKVLDIFLVVGDWDQLEALHAQVMAFARERDCTMVRAFGRNGWQREAEQHGWRTDMRVYLKDV